MNTIKFSHLYKKMPPILNPTYLKDVAIIDYKLLTPEQIEQDTAIVGGGNYPLPHTRLIWLKLWTEGHEWGTMRRYTPGKWDYYSRLVGSEVNIQIVKEDQ